jgi:hypothetical protein
MLVNPSLLSVSLKGFCACKSNKTQKSCFVSSHARTGGCVGRGVMRFRKLDRALHLQPRVVSHSDLLTNIVVKVQKTSNHGKHRGPIFVPDVGGDHTMTVQNTKLIRFLALATRHLLRYNTTWPPDTITPVTRYKRQMPGTINCVSCLDEHNRKNI